MAIMAVQQFALRNALNTEKKAEHTLAAVKSAGYEGIELCSFLLYKLPFYIRVLTKLAGMGIGSCGKLDWRSLIGWSELKVVSMHNDLGSVEKDPDKAARLAAGFGTDNVVITGMHRFDYSDKAAVLALAERLNKSGKEMQSRGAKLLYHNHNCEFNHIGGKLALELLIENTDPELVNFEFDSYWAAETGCDPLEIMDMLGSRMKLYHINDRGVRTRGKRMSILKSDSMELGTGCMPLAKLIKKAEDCGAEAIILESHRNWIDNDPVKSMELSGKFLNGMKNKTE